MWIIAHAFSGLAWGAWAPLGLAPLLLTSLLLHVLLDLVPHWDYTRHRWRHLWALSDLVLSIASVVALALLFDLGLPAVLAAVVSALPDLDVLDSLLTRAGHHGPAGSAPARRGTARRRPARRRLFPSHWERFPHGQAGPGPGIAVQVVVVLGSLAAIFLSAR